MSVPGWLHRKGIARMLDSSTQSWSDMGGAYIEARGTHRIAARLAMYALRHSTIASPDWQTVRIVRTQQPGRLHWRFDVTFRRLPW